MASEIEEILRQRVALLDAAENTALFGMSGIRERLVHAARVLSSYTNTSHPAAVGHDIVAAHADDLTGASALLAALVVLQPDLVAGPLDRDRQDWTGITRDAGARPTGDRTGRSIAPNVAGLAEPAAPTDPPSAQPHDMGLYTSTAARPGGPSMWRLYLEDYRGSDLYPLPWDTWRLPVEQTATIHEIVSAKDWADFVATYPRIHGNYVYPQWHEAASDLDAVHLSLRAVAAIQGVSIRTTVGPSAPIFWDVESTLWLRWRFSPPRFLGRTS